MVKVEMFKMNYLDIVNRFGGKIIPYHLPSWI